MGPYIRNTKIAGILFLFLFVLFSLPQAARAEGEGSFSVSPLFSDISLDTTETLKSFFLTVSNTTSDPVVLRISLVDFGSLNESGGIAFLGKESNGTNRYALASWITPEKDVVTLLPGAEEQIKLTVENKESLSPGGHYAAALFSVEPEEGRSEDAEPNVSLNPTFSALIFAKKEGGIIRELAFKETRIDTRSLWSALPEKALVRFQNSGNVDLTPRGRIILTDPLGRSVAKGILNEDSARILPESFRNCSVMLRPIAPRLVPGFYTLSTEYRFDGQDNAQSAPKQRVFAWGVAFWWLVGVGLLLFIGVRVFRRLRSRRVGAV